MFVFIEFLLIRKCETLLRRYRWQYLEHRGDIGTSARFVLIQGSLSNSAYACVRVPYLNVLIVCPASSHLTICHLDIKPHPFKSGAVW